MFRIIAAMAIGRHFDAGRSATTSQSSAPTLNGNAEGLPRALATAHVCASDPVTACNKN